MSWQNIDMTDVPTGRELLPVGDYTVEVLPGSKAGKFDPNAIDVPLAVVGGEFGGRRLFGGFPDPDKQDWSPQAVKRTAVAIGAEFEKGEHPIAYFNRVAGLRFILPVGQTEKEGVKYQRLNFLNAKAARS